MHIWSFHEETLYICLPLCLLGAFTINATKRSGLFKRNIHAVLIVVVAFYLIFFNSRANLVSKTSIN